MDTNPIFRLTYASSAVGEFATPDLLSLLARARARNAAHGLTGLLLHRLGNFIQVLEGPEPAVRATFDRIARDPRHAGVMVLDEGRMPDRMFPEWSMGFDHAWTLDAATYPGLSAFLRDRLDRLRDDGDVAAEMLRAFRDGR